MSRDIIIGDVHGCVDELTSLLDKVNPIRGDRVFFLGDLVDRGPDSMGVIRMVQSVLADYPGSEAVVGNHEIKWLRSILARDVSQDVVDWLRARPLFVRPHHRLFLCHGGVPPAFAEDVPDLRAEDAHALPHGKRGKALSRLAYVRRVDPRTRRESVSGRDENTVPWAVLYDGSLGFVVYGHQPALLPTRFPHALGIDTGCCFGGMLTAAIAEDGRVEEIVSVHARSSYAESTMFRYARGHDRRD